MRLVSYQMQRTLLAALNSTAFCFAALALLAVSAVIILTAAASLPHLFGGLHDGVASILELRSETIRSLKYAVVTATAQLCIAMVLALACLAHWPIRSPILILLLLPYFIPSSFVHTSFQLLFLPQGAGAQLFALIGVAPNWWTSDEGRFVRLCAASVWQFWPFAFLLALARLLAVSPSELRSTALASRHPHETLLVIGFRHLLHIMVAILVARVLFMMSKFDLPYLMSIEQLNKSNVVTVEYLHRLSTKSDNVALLTQSVAAPSAILLSFALLAALFVIAQRWLDRRRYAPEAFVRRLFGWANPAIRWWLTAGATVLAIYVITPLLVLATAAFTADSELQNGWMPADVFTQPTLGHLRASLQDFRDSRSTSWSHAFVRTMVLSTCVSLVATATAAIVGAILALRLRGPRLVAQLFSIVVFGIPTAIWIFAIAWSSPALSLHLPQDTCLDDEGMRSLIRGAGCQTMVLWGLHFTFVTAIALYMSMAFWQRTTSYEGFKLLKLYGVDAAHPMQVLRALWLVRRRQLIGVCCAVFPIVFAVSWSDISFSRYIAADGKKLFADVAVSSLNGSSADGTLFGQMAAAALLALIVACPMGLLVRRGLR